MSRLQKLQDISALNENLSLHAQLTSRIIIFILFLLLFLVGWDWVHLVLRSLLVYCTNPQMIDDGDCGAIGGMTIGRGNRSIREKTFPSATLSTTNPTWADPGSNSGRRGGKPAMARPTHKHDFHWSEGNKIFSESKYFVQTMLVSGHRQSNHLGKVPKSWLTIKLTPWRYISWL
jgi:hypothetical protein